ncbi:transglutaminase domain-containing protein [Flavobacterium sp.]|jgi:hypothetical protein|uniref:transglutaminase domain-containing protein n=1 Tax=Flavobacterium sp. TaxID=239 RepID=UPI0022C9A936|nr:transglutaminase domain-containing protein [Flavobacterium sp.]MCZ8146002.1 hypothetical protein [Flavobacterium sp.]MCZ8367221.1 hypothetical protein [Flavobacterium sp.]
MKKIVIICLVLVQGLVAQTSEKKVWDLLLANKREEARKLFDKELKSKKETQTEYLILDAILTHEMGQMSFDDTFLKQFLATCKDRAYLYPIFYKPYVMDSPNGNGYNEYTYKKIDLLAAHPLFGTDPMVIYFKAICDRRRRDYAGFEKAITQLKALDSWQYCGVFENLNDSGFDTEYEPETYANNDKLFDANSNGKVGWYNPVDRDREGYHIFNNEAEYGDGIMYAQLFLDNPKTQEVYLNFGASSSIKFFLNDTEIYSNNDVDATDMNAFRVKFTLPQGMNRLLVKLSTDGSNDNFFVSLLDAQGNEIQGLNKYNTYKPYQKSTFEQLNPVELEVEHEAFFKQKIAQNPDNVLYKILLFEAYNNNSKNELATDIIEELTKLYPKSSLIQVMQIANLNNRDENQKSEEVAKNIEVNDEGYYYNFLMKVQDSDWLRSTSIIELEKFREKLKSVKSEAINTVFDFILASRKSDLNQMTTKLEELFSNSNYNEFYITSFVNVYERLKNDKSKAIAMMEEMLAKRENFTALKNLISYYDDANRKEDVMRLTKEVSDRYPFHNGLRDDYADLLIKEKRYDEAMVEIDRALQNFPYSFRLMQQKGTIYNNQNKLKEAEVYFRKSLTHNSGNSNLRKQLYDMTKTPDEIEEVASKDIYEIIKKRRNTTLKGDFGVTVLLDEYIVNVLPEGGRKSKVTYLYEITSEQGIEEMKEYDMQSYRNSLLKSEVIKQDGTIVPAEEGSGTLVFTDLKVGDVIFIQYERYENSYGRFYRDFDVSCYFNSFYPAVEVIFGIIYPQDVQFLTHFSNGNVTPIQKKINGRNLSLYKRTNVPAMPLQEPYAADNSDLTNTIRIGTIKSWKEISNWYSDLVKKQLKQDKVTRKTFAEIFPKGVAGMSQEAIAKAIYTYIESNIKYSSQDFRQSGHVPQKPSKTITTKLGDCKDVSTLFVALAEQAGLKANLVLVMTNDNGFSSMALPTNEFNHCIVKVMLDGKDHFLELTDKYLPFKALPSSLFTANALVISFDKAENEKAQIIRIPFDNALRNVARAKTEVTLDDNVKTFVNTFTVEGANKSYYNELFSDATTEDIRKKRIEEDYNNKLKKNVTFQSAKSIQNDTYEKGITFETRFTIAERLQNVGNLKITEIPFLDKVYTRDIVALDKRNYPIQYFKYENSNAYHSEVILTIPTGKKFSEIPESKTFQYKGHSYSLRFESVSPNVLKVTRDVTLDWNDIDTAEYLNYKKYVEDVIAAEEQIVGFK